MSFIELFYRCLESIKIGVHFLYIDYLRYIISRRYKAGSVINVIVRLTASHLGHFEFNLCPLKTKKELETDECFNTYPLPLADGSGYKYPITTKESKEYTVNLVLPKGVTCEQCVIRSGLRTKSHTESRLILILLILGIKMIILNYS